jgi:hypothetical protein
MAPLNEGAVYLGGIANLGYSGLSILGPSIFHPTFYRSYEPKCQVVTMEWILTLAFFAFLYWRARKAQERAAEYAATGMLHSPLYWTAIILVCVLIGLAFSERYVLDQGSTLIWMWWAALGATVIALLIVPRALKWRYPI